MTRKRIVHRSIVACGVAVFAVGIFGGLSSVASDVGGAIDPAAFSQTLDLKGDELQQALGIPTLSWKRADDGSIILTAPPGYEHLQDCDESIAAVRIVHGDGKAYCIPGVGGDADAGFRAMSAILRIAQDRLPSETELRMIAINNELAYVDPESEGHDQLLAEYERLWKELTPSERETIEAGYAALAVGGADGA
jgi:hypothetical protein